MRACLHTPVLGKHQPGAPSVCHHQLHHLHIPSPPLPMQPAHMNEGVRRQCATPPHTDAYNLPMRPPAVVPPCSPNGALHRSVPLSSASRLMVISVGSGVWCAIISRLCCGRRCARTPPTGGAAAGVSKCVCVRACVRRLRVCDVCVWGEELMRMYLLAHKSHKYTTHTGGGGGCGQGLSGGRAGGGGCGSCCRSGIGGRGNDGAGGDVTCGRGPQCDGRSSNMRGYVCARGSWLPPAQPTNRHTHTHTHTVKYKHTTTTCPTTSSTSPRPHPTLVCLHRLSDLPCGCAAIHMVVGGVSHDQAACGRTKCRYQVIGPRRAPCLQLWRT